MDKNKLRSLLNEGKTTSALDGLLEELEAKATKKATPELYNPELGNNDLYSSDKHSKSDEVKPVIVEGKDLSAKEKMSLLLEKYGVSSMKELDAVSRAGFLKELNDPKTKFVKAKVLLEETDPAVIRAKAVDKNADAKVMQQKRLNKESISKGPSIMNDPEIIKANNKALKNESNEEEKIDAEEPILEPEVPANDKDVAEVESPESEDIDDETEKEKEGDDTIKKDIKALSKDDNIQGVTESMESIFDILTSKSLYEEEVTSKGEIASKPVATEDSEGESKEPNTDNEDVYTNDEHKEKEEVEEVVVESEVIDNKGDLVKLKKVHEPVIVDGKTTVKPHDHADGDETVEETDVEAVIKDGKAVAPDHDHADAEGKKVRDELIEEVTSKGDVAAEPVATKEDEGTSEKPDEDNEDVYPADDHEEKEEVKEVIVESEEKEDDEKEDSDEKKSEEKEEEVKVEDNISVSDEDVQISLPIKKDEKFSKELSDKEKEIVTEALKIVYGIFSGANLNESEEVVIPDNSEADVKVFKDKIEITIPIEGPKDEISEEDAERLQEALTVLDAVLKETSIAGIAGIASTPNVETKEDKDPQKATDIDNDDLYPTDEHKKNEDLKPVVVEEVTSKGEVAAEPVATKEDDGSADAPKTDGKDVYPADEHKEKEEVKEVVVEEVTSKGDAAVKPVATKEDDGSAEEPKEDNKDVYPTDEHKEKEEVEEVLVENRKIDDEIARLQNVAANASGPTIDTIDERIKTLLAQKKAAKEIVAEEVTSKGEVAAEPIATKEDDGSADVPKTDGKDVYPADEHKEKEEVKEVIVESEDEEKDKDEEKAEPEDVTTEKDDKESDDKEDEDELDEDEEKAESEDVTTEYKSIKEAFLLEHDYFSKDSKVLLTANDKRVKLENQLSLLVARDAQDPLYEELVKTTIIAKKLQEEIHNRYKKQASSKSKELISLKEGAAPKKN